MKPHFFNIRSAYGQLILLIFLPIFLLASVGGVLVYSETMHAHRHEQQILAKAILIRYQPVIEDQLPSIIAENNASKNTQPVNNNQLQNLLFSVRTESQLQRIAIIDEDGNVLESAGFKALDSWNNFNLESSILKDITHHNYDTFITDVTNEESTAYGISLGYLTIDGQKKILWLFVDMDNQPLKIAQYRVALALSITGLLVVLLLLLSLNIYSRRWIEPIYQIRLFLQGINIDNLTKPLSVNANGELLELKQDLSTTLKIINDSFHELKEHSNQTEEDLRQAFDEMEMQNISIRNAHDQAISISEAKSAFLTNISHELRTPLNSIDGFINLLARNDKLSAEQDLYVQTIRKSSAHLLALVNDVLDFSKIEAGKLVLDSHEFDLYTAIYDVADMLSPLATEKNLRLAVLFYNDVPLNIIGDALRMKQVLTNLVANAIKFTDIGEVLVKVSLDEERDNYLTIMVQDTGRGVRKEDQSLLFQNFTQGDPSITRQYGGTGLGLVISKQLTQLMGGSIGYYDNESSNLSAKGSTFWFGVPAHVDVLEVESANDISLPILSDHKNVSLNKLKQKQELKILVWIDHIASIQVLRASLQALPIKITQTHSLISTLDLLEQKGKKWDWVIVDSNASTHSENIGDMTALLKQLRLHYQGKLAVYGYQVALNNELLKRYQAHSLHEPLDKRQLYSMLDRRKGQENKIKGDVPRWQGHCVLAVDDHLPNLLVLDALLDEQGIEVITANSGFDAIEIVSRQATDPNAKTIDLIFMDIQMPRMSGQQASEQIRDIESKKPQIPIIALTAHGMSDERDKLIQSGINDYVGKPISQPQLLQILQKWLGKKPDGTLTSRCSINTNEVEIQRDTALSTIRQTSDIHFNNGEQNNQVVVNNFNLMRKQKKSLEKLVTIDWEDALTRSANKPNLASKLMIMMIDSIPEEKQSLQTAWEAQDCTALAQTAHRILGASRYTGVPEIRFASQQLEDNCVAFNNNNDSRNNSERSSEDNPQLDNIEADYQQLLQALDNLANIDLSPWPQLRYHRLDEDSMNWKMI